MRAFCAAVFISLMIPGAALASSEPDAPLPTRPATPVGSEMACKGCGCRGGPGYRGPNGKCVGWDDLIKICGDPPMTRCTKEGGK